MPPAMTVINYRRFAAAGQFLWTTTPYGDPHASTWKAPGYPAFVGLLYKVFGDSPDRAMTFQAVISAPLTVGLSWAFARKLFTPAVGIVVAIPAGTNEDTAAALIRTAIDQRFGEGVYATEIDDGEDVLVKAHGSTPDFELVLVRNTATGLELHLERE